MAQHCVTTGTNLTRITSYCDQLLSLTHRIIVQWGSISSYVAALVPDVACCIFIGEKTFSTSQSNLAFIQDKCCHLTMLWHPMETNWENTTIVISNPRGVSWIIQTVCLHCKLSLGEFYNIDHTSPVFNCKGKMFQEIVRSSKWVEIGRRKFEIQIREEINNKIIFVATRPLRPSPAHAEWPSGGRRPGYLIQKDLIGTENFGPWRFHFRTCSFHFWVNLLSIGNVLLNDFKFTVLRS